MMAFAGGPGAVATGLPARPRMSGTPGTVVARASGVR